MEYSEWDQKSALANATSPIYNEMAGIIESLNCKEHDKIRESNEMYYQRLEDLKVEVEVEEGEFELVYPERSDQDVESIEQDRRDAEKAIEVEYARVRKRYEAIADHTANRAMTRVHMQFTQRSISRKSGLIFVM